MLQAQKNALVQRVFAALFILMLTISAVSISFTSNTTNPGLFQTSGLSAESNVSIATACTGGGSNGSSGDC